MTGRQKIKTCFYQVVILRTKFLPKNSPGWILPEYWDRVPYFVSKILLSNICYSRFSLFANYVYLFQKAKFFMKDFFSNCHQFRRTLWIWPHLPEKSWRKNFLFCALYKTHTIGIAFSSGSHPRVPYKKFIRKEFFFFFL